jgi:DNA-binding CsgD family transcriptional regulator
MMERQAASTELDSSLSLQPGDPYPFWVLFDNSSACIAQLNLQLQLTGGNAGFADAFGVPAAALPGRPLIDLVHPSVRDKLARRLMSLASGERSRFTDWVVPYTGSTTTSVELTGLAVTNDADCVDSLIVLVQQEQAESAALTTQADLIKPLSRMDARVLEGVAAGMSTIQLAAKLFLSRGGVEYHVSALMKNLKAVNRSELVSRAYSAGLFSVGSWPPRVITDFID